MLELYFILAVALFYAILRIRRRLFIYFLLNKGEVLYIDDGATSVIRDAEYRVSARPDRVTKYRGKNYVLEFKSRKRNIYEKDVIQGFVGCIAAWEKFGRIDGLVVYNGSYQFKFYSLRTKVACYKKVKNAIYKAQKIKSKKTVKEKVIVSKCRVCPYNQSCKKSKHR